MALIAQLNFLLAKEYTGQMRALGSAVCAQAGFEPFQFERFQTLAKQRDESLGVFVRHAARDQLDRWAELQTSESFVQWETYRRARSKRPDFEGLGRLPDAESWYTWSTATIDTMRTAEVGLLDGLDDLCIHILAETRNGVGGQPRKVPRPSMPPFSSSLERARVRLLEERRDLRLNSRAEAERRVADPVSPDGPGRASRPPPPSASLTEWRQRPGSVESDHP